MAVRRPSMYAASSSSASPPQLEPTRPQHNCLECKRLKRACDKGFPCGKCFKAGRICEYRDPADDGLFGPISAAKNINSLAFGTLLDIFVNRSRVREAVSLYFTDINVWFTIVEKASFERQLDIAWDNLPAESSVMALCMALVASPPNQKSSKGIDDTIYLATKGILTIIRASVPMSIQLLQTELLLAMYEFSQAKPAEAHHSLCRCFQMTKTFGWHSPEFWTDERKASMPKELKLYSILWWTVVYLNCLLDVAYQDPAIPMQTIDLAPESMIPFPETLDVHLTAGLMFPFGNHNQGFPNTSSDQIDSIVFPEAKSAWFLSKVLQQLSNPMFPIIADPNKFSQEVLNHAQAMTRNGRTAAVGADFIAIMKLNHLGLFSANVLAAMADENHAAAVRVIQIVTGVIHGKAGGLVEPGDRQNRGTLDPCWPFAMNYAAILLISHGEGALQDANWMHKVANLRAGLDKLSKRWKIAEQYCESVRTALDNHLPGYPR